MHATLTDTCTITFCLLAGCTRKTNSSFGFGMKCIKICFTYRRKVCIQINLISSAVNFAKITPVISACKLQSEPHWPGSKHEGEDLVTSALIILICAYLRSLYWNFWHCFSSNQSSYQTALKKN